MRTLDNLARLALEQQRATMEQHLRERSLEHEIHEAQHRTPPVSHERTVPEPRSTPCPDCRTVTGPA